MSFNPCDIEYERQKAEDEKNNAYWERNQLIDYLSKLYPSWVEKHPLEDSELEDDWRNVIFIDMPGGQCSWHIHDTELPNFEHLNFRSGNSWDGHTRHEKYERIMKSFK
jgi:hypothetical protein